MPTLPPPSNYICFRCGQKGHYIANCPTMADPNYNRPKIRKTTGIPKTFLRPVESVPDSSDPSSTLVPPTGNVLISAEGNLVSLKTNEELWNRVSGMSRAQDSAAERAPEHFKCPLCLRVLNDPVYFACCPDVNYCDECKFLAL
jgi:protein MPE1